jgi:hypothetical protein
MPFGHLWTNRGWTRSELQQYADGKIWLEAGLPGYAADDETLLPVPEAARAHARGLLQQLDEWEAECDRLRAPFVRLDTARASLSDKLTETADRIALCPARSWAGLAAKASTVKAAIDEESGLTSVLGRKERPWHGARLGPEGPGLASIHGRLQCDREG